RWRCSMWITHCGSAHSLANLRTAAAGLRGSWPIGSVRWLGCRSGWIFLRIGLIRWLLIIVALAWWWIGRRSCSSGLLGWLVSIARRVSWWFRLLWRCC